MSDNKSYVLGFCFNSDLTKIVLINKQRPAWQKGRLNGIGGSIEKDESAIAAMFREFKEETNVDIYDWDNFAIYKGMFGKLYIFVSIIDFNTVTFTSMTDEIIEILPVKDVINIDKGVYNNNIIGNIPWMIHMAYNFIINMKRDYYFEIIERTH